MPEDLLNVHGVNAGADEVTGMTVAEDVGSDPDIKPGEFTITGHQLLNTANRQRTMNPILKQWSRRRCAEPPRCVER